MNRRFRVKGISGIETYIELLNEAPGGYEARITSISEHGVRESCEYISDDLLNSCIRTGYLSLVEELPVEREAETVLSA
ncbi:MAG: hypothetical protein ACOCYX_04320 [Spirochaetota bacterium]